MQTFQCYWRLEQQSLWVFQFLCSAMMSLKVGRQLGQTKIIWVFFNDRYNWHSSSRLFRDFGSFSVEINSQPTPHFSVKDTVGVRESVIVLISCLIDFTISVSRGWIFFDARILQKLNNLTCLVSSRSSFKKESHPSKQITRMRFGSSIQSSSCFWTLTISSKLWLFAWSAC